MPSTCWKERASSNEAPPTAHPTSSAIDSGCSPVKSCARGRWVGGWVIWQAGGRSVWQVMGCSRGRAGALIGFRVKCSKQEWKELTGANMQHMAEPQGWGHANS
jgi:hypothetical protein